MNHWERTARDVIEKVREKFPEARGTELKKHLFESYPFGMRKYQPYRIWLKLVNEACGTQKSTPSDRAKLAQWNSAAKKWLDRGAEKEI